MDELPATTPQGSTAALRIERELRPVVIQRHDAVIAASRDALLVHGLSETPIYFVPRRDVYTEHLVETGTGPGLGGRDAKFWSVTASGGGLENAVWMFLRPEGAIEPLLDHFGFDPNPFNITAG
ncbi:DUF427 domain-containing protein [Aurantimonas sp. HBX-1]|uniref:DUF427 domain-containing protein n=1 Tax=Aurantimonas sp. HBX-1 TaxID=2906072 RepID=UPI001F2F46D2|nr:DUF427 domain-containing protein [Aurantimonas sp. HBX-1]UIJ70781.1 DUF427 domain-containing protein [Aurantimonas sp. HBX-1]